MTTPNEVAYTRCWSGKTLGRKYFLTINRVPLDTVGRDGANKTATLTIFPRNGADIDSMFERKYWYGTSNDWIRNNLLDIAAS